MKDKTLQIKKLSAGEVYGEILERRATNSTVLSEIRHNRKAVVPIHSHKLAFFNFVLNGNYSEIYGRKSLVCNPMTILWCPSEVSHKDEIGNTGAHQFNIEIKQSCVELLREYSPIPESFSTQTTPLVSLSLRLYKEFKNWQLCSPLIVEGLVLEMLGVASRKESPTDKTPPKWLLNIIEKLNSDFVNKYSVKELALDEGVHPVHLAAVFRQFHKRSIGEYIQNLRVNHASKLLCTKEIPLSEIALTSGFTDQSHFTRVFRRFTGTTPGAYRDSLK